MENMCSTYKYTQLILFPFFVATVFSFRTENKSA
jgi:hypothetical protein